MKSAARLNGCDYLMLGFDRELRSRGYAGNSCQIILELDGPVELPALQCQINKIWGENPRLSARPGGVILPRWKSVGGLATGPTARAHADHPRLARELFNEPLALRRGELARFDVVDGAAGSKIVFTWAHALMDALGAERFLARVGGAEWPASNLADAAAPHSPRRKLKERLQFAWKYLHHVERLGKTPPRSLGVRFPQEAPILEHRLEKFSAEETETIRGHSQRLGGFLGDSQFHAAMAMLELHALHQRLGQPSPSYVLPVPVGLRAKGAPGPLFGNQVAMLMHQFLPEHLATAAGAVAVLKQQTAQAMREDLLESGRALSELFRFLPRSVYMSFLKKGLRGEICSLFYGNTGAVTPLLETFLGVRVADVTHAAAVTPSPGVGVIFYYFRDRLRLTVLRSAQVLSATEASEFAARLRARLLQP